MLRFRADYRTLFFISLYFVGLVSLWLAPPMAGWIKGLGVAGLCVLAFMGAVTTHNAIHCPIFRRRGLNKIFQIVLSLTYGHPVSSYVPGHNLSHHKHTQTRRDVMRTTKARFGYHLLNGLLFLPIIAKDIMRADTAYSKVMRTRHPRWFRQLMAEVIVFWSVQIGLFVLDWRNALLLWLLPHLYAQWGIVTMNLLQHDGCDQDSTFNHSRNFVGRALNFFAYNNGYHTIHHRMPGLHWSLTREAHQKDVAPHIHPNLDQGSMPRFLMYSFVLNHREWYDGTPLVLPEEGPDEDWIPAPHQTTQDLGAESIDAPDGSGCLAEVHVSEAAASLYTIPR